MSATVSVCDECDKTYSGLNRKRSLRMHKRTVHNALKMTTGRPRNNPELPTVVCDYCEGQFSSKQSLHKHRIAQHAVVKRASRGRPKNLPEGEFEVEKIMAKRINEKQVKIVSIIDAPLQFLLNTIYFVFF